MAQRHKSAIKRHRQSLKRAERNRAVRTHVRHTIRVLRECIAQKQTDTVDAKLRLVMKTLDQAVTKGVLHRNNAARHISRLSRQVRGLKAAATAPAA